MQAASSRTSLAGIPEPFPGLRPFENDEEPIFRGRQQHTDELLRRLSAHRFLAVVGTSGSGKSSLVRAGLRPALDRGYLAGATSRWRIAVMRPGMAPIENLAEALRQPEALGAADAAKLRSSRLGLVEAVRDAHLTPGESLLVVADQFEELFRYQRRMSEIDGGGDAAQFVNLLLTAATRPDAPIYVVLTMRSDFLGDCAQFPGLPEVLSESQYLIPRLTRVERRQAIEEPLRLFGATMTPQLVEQLLNDSGDEVSDPAAGAHYRGGAPDPLPVLQHALMRTYLEWKSLPRTEGDGRIDLTHYRKAGRMESALDQHAEWAFTKELDDAGRHSAERIFRCLTTTELGRPVRRPTLLADLYQVVGGDQKQIDEVLAVCQRPENSFLKVHQDTTVDISHESLIWKWKRLSDWVAKEAAGAELYRDLVKDAQGKATWSEPKLSSTLAVRKQDAWNAGWARQYSESSFSDVEAFLARSRGAARKQKLLRWFGAAAAVALVILSVMAYYSSRQAFQKARELDALLVVQNGTESRANDLAQRIAGLNATQGATKEERDRIASEKSDLEAQLAKTQQAQAQKSTDLLATVQSLQSRLDQAQRDRDDAVQGRATETKLRQDAETKAAQLDARVTTLTKDLEGARAAAPKPEPVKQPPATPLQIPAPEPAAAAVQGSRTLEGHKSTVFSVAWSPDGKTLASGSGDDTVRLWDAPSGQLLRSLEGRSGIMAAMFSVAWSPDGKSLAAGDFTHTMHLWDSSSGKLLRTLEGHRDSVTGVAWSPDGKTLASASGDATVRLWDASSGQPVRTLKGHKAAVLRVAWSSNGKTLASGSADHTVRLWDTSSGQTLRILVGHQGNILGVAWSPDGKTLASASADSTIRLWDGATGQLVRKLEGHPGKGSYGVAWSPDGKTLVSGGGDKTVRLWETSSGRLVRVFEGHTDTVWSVAWSPDGKTVASASGDKTVRLWAIP